MKFVFASCELDLRRRELNRSGAIVHVEPQVYDLLVHLVQNHERVVSKDELLDTIWGGRIVSDAALSSRINAARRAIGDDGGEQRLIKTIHRRGFRFIGSVRQEDSDPAYPPPAASRSADHTLAPAISHEVPPSGPSLTGSKPSIAVLPFVNLNHEAATDYFTYGLTEDIIRLLARNRWLDVLSRHSAVPFRGPNAEPREIGAALGVRYLIQGTVLKRDDHVRITTDLVETEAGRHVWGESYDFVLADLLEVQTKMAQQIAAVIEPELARVEREAAVRRAPTNLDAWDCYQRGLWHLWGFTEPGLAEAESMFRKAVDLDPGFARAYGALAYVKLQSLVTRAPHERATLLDEALRQGRVAVSLDGQDCMNLCVVGRVLCFQHEYDDAIAYLEDAITVNPSFAQAYFALGFTLIASGRAAEAIPHLDRANELSPRDPHLASFFATRALAHLSLDELEDAVAYARKAMRVPTTNHWPFATLASVLGLMGRTDEARRAAEALRTKYPAYTLATAQSDFFFCSDMKLVDRYLKGLRSAGIPNAEPESAPASASGSRRLRADRSMGQRGS